MNDNMMTQDEALKLIADAVFYHNSINGNEDRVFEQLHDYIDDLNTPKQVFTCKGDIIDQLNAYKELGTVEELSALKGNLDAVWYMYQSAEREAKRYKRIQTPMRPIIENWSPTKCPTCEEDFHEFEECNDGYYSRCHSMDRCPYCGQKLDWREV